jgi:hypothetical protein
MLEGEMGQELSPDAIVAEARAQVAAGRAPDLEALAARLRGVATDDAGRRRALAQLERVAAVHRARTLVERPAGPPAPKPASAPLPGRSLRAALRTKPTIVGNLEVRREDGFALAWDAVPAVAAWEVRFSERADARSDYRELEALDLPAQTTRVEVPLGDRLFRVNVIGRSRDGRPVRRALVSALTRETWADRWQRRATAS